MKKWGLILLVVVGLWFTFFTKDSIFKSKIEIHEYEQIINDEPSKNMVKKELGVEQIYQGNLLLVNREHPVHQESMKSDIINVATHHDVRTGYTVFKDEMLLSEDIARKFSDMMDTALRDDVRHFLINSGFRPFKEQDELYKEKGSAYALPAGYSEHNLGLSLDVGSTQSKMAEAPEGKWLEENAWMHGFVLRYPKNKTDVTGIQYEPWHIRYVGLPHSAIMQEKDFVLEEYVEYLKKEKKITASMNGRNYTITYYPITQRTKIEVPENSHYEISGNNMDGVIVTVFE